MTYTSDAPVAAVLNDRLPRPLLGALTAILLVSSLVPDWLWGANSGTVFPLTLHTVTEFVAIVAAFLVFFIAWHARVPGQPGTITLIGCGFLAVGLIDFGHTLSYKGMPDFVTAADPEKAIRFWLAARYVSVLTLVLAAWRTPLPLRSERARWGMLMAACALSVVTYIVQLYFPQAWPPLFVEGQGLTRFKLGAEAGVIVLAALAAWGFYRSRGQQDLFSASQLCTASLITILSEVCLMQYASMHDIYMLLGHVYKIIAYFYIYRAVFVTSVSTPYQRLHHEIQERVQAEARIEFLAYHDALTHLPNRDLTRDRMVQAIADARRNKQLTALVFIDLDNFKSVNDTLGHAAGDTLLKTVAYRLKEQVREVDTVGRQGGDEFLVVLKDLRDADGVSAVVAKLVDSLQRPIEVDGHELATTASIGIAMYPHDGDDFDALLQKADTAMYRAKSEGRNTYRFYDEHMNAEALQRLNIRNGLRKALDSGQFLLHYQPQIDLRSGRLQGVEALVRWQHPVWGMVSPAQFIPIAEESGLIVQLGTWVVQEACAQAARWHGQGWSALTMGVNLSAVQFQRGDVEAVVASALSASGLPAGALELELTESVLMSDPDAVQGRLRALTSMGVRLAIDDFGTGYSSLSYLKRFAVNRLKIDQSFVRELARNPEDLAIVRAIIQMASSLGLETIAEGVETEQVATLLLELGCQQAQGYWIARPMTADAFAQWRMAYVATKETGAVPA